MAEFVYRAIAKNGKEIHGNMEAESEAQAMGKLKNQGLMPLEVKKANALNKEITISIGNPVKPRDLSVFCRQLVSMLNAGITILDALAMLSQQTENKAMKKAIREVQADIEKGETLSMALKKHPKIFPSLMISMVSAGEASGKLETAFERMSEHFEKDAKIRGLLKKSAMYPIVVAVVAVVVVIVMLVKVIPSYTSMFEQMDMELPLLTRMVVDMSEFIQHRWPILLAIVGAIAVGINMFRQTETGELLFGNIARKLPVFGPLNIKTAASLFSRTLSTLLASGLSMVDSLEIVANTMQNAVYRNALKEAREEVVKGVPLSEPLANCALFPPMVTHMTKIGEETGDIESMLDRLAGYYDEEVEMATQTVMAALEPMIIVVMAIIVVFLVGAIMSPMLSMYTGLDNL